MKESINEDKLKTEELVEWLLITMNPVIFVKKALKGLKTEEIELPAKATDMSTKKNSDQCQLHKFEDLIAVKRLSSRFL